MNKLIFCFDGTCNEPEDAGDFFEDSSITNVLKLHLLYGGKLSPLNQRNDRNDIHPEQHSFYYSGVGTRGTWISKMINAALAPPYGDMEDILDQANANLEQHYNADSEIYIFGFSRGAAIARRFAAKCSKKIKFLGVFDTVAATRGSLDLNPDTYPSSGVVFENGSIGDHIEKAVHLVAIDEKRIAFQPTLLNLDERVVEVWFAGTHSDIGGGYWFNGLSDITLEFMLREAKRAGLKALNKKKLTGGSIMTIENTDGAITWDDVSMKPLADGVLHEQKRSKKIADKTLAPRLVRTNVNDHPSQMLPIVHYTVQDRFTAVANYRPYALRGRRFRVISRTGRIGTKVYHGISSL